MEGTKIELHDGDVIRLETGFHLMHFLQGASGPALLSGIPLEHTADMEITVAKIDPATSKSDVFAGRVLLIIPGVILHLTACAPDEAFGVRPIRGAHDAPEDDGPTGVGGRSLHKIRLERIASTGKAALSIAEIRRGEDANVIHVADRPLVPPLEASFPRRPCDPGLQTAGASGISPGPRHGATRISPPAHADRAPRNPFSNSRRKRSV